MNDISRYITSCTVGALLAVAGSCAGREPGLPASGLPAPPGTPHAAGPPESATGLGQPPVVRGQSPSWSGAPYNTATPGSNDYWRQPMRPSGEVRFSDQNAPASNFQPGGAAAPSAPLGAGANPAPSSSTESVQTLEGQNVFGPNFAPISPGAVPPTAAEIGPVAPSVDLDVLLEETRTGRVMFGMGVNSNLGVTGQIVVDERNFDWRRPPTSFRDIINGTAFRGGGQGFRLEAMPGSEVQRYLASFTQPYLYLPGFPDPFSMSLSGFFFDRRYFDWNEQRLGGRASLGYRLTPDLSLTNSIRMENVNVRDPRVVGLEPELDRVLGDNELYSGGVTLTHDTRDTPFAPTEGHLIELSYSQVFGTFDYPRGEVDYRKHFLLRERPDGSGRHTLSYSFRLGFSGAQTPLFENFFAGGYSSLRGFEFRGASPVGAAGVIVGGRFQMLNSVEYLFPLTADDMIKGVVFVDYGTVERNIEIQSDNYRVAPGFGLRVAVPALGPAPLALDFAFPVAHADSDDIENFSFFIGFGR